MSLEKLFYLNFKLHNYPFDILVPPSETSDTDDHDSVHSLPVGSTRTKVSTPAHSVSSGHTPQVNPVQYRTVQYSVVQYSTVQLCIVQ